MEEISIPLKEVRQATTNNADAVWKIIEACSLWLKENGHSHWANYYTKERVVEKINNATVLLASNNEEPIGTITLDFNPVSYYTSKDMSSFSEPEAEALYISMLATLPTYQGKGAASQFMEYAEAEALARKVKYLRLDCKALYPELVTFYRKKGFIVTGVLTDENDNYEPYFLMEKNLIPKVS